MWDDSLLPRLHEASPSLHLHGEWTELINGKEFFVGFQASQDISDLFDFRLVVRIVAGQENLCFTEFVPSITDDLVDAVLAHCEVLLRHHLPNVFPSPRCSIDPMSRWRRMEDGKNLFLVALQFVFPQSFPSVLAEPINAFVLIMPSNAVNVMRTDSQEMPDG